MSSAASALSHDRLVLDRYRPIRPVGRGASGSVWLARDERTGLDVALKIVPREGKRESRAAREAEVASRLRHPRCVRAYGFGGDADHVYIAYEYVHGRTMREAMRTASLLDADAVEAAAQVLEGLAHAHQHGIVHRDVKPSNVLLVEGDGVEVKLLDFGLAQFDEFDTLTAVGDVPGTLAYIAPERLRGEEASPASDVWAVGVMLWEALVGRHPFWGVPMPEVASAIEAGAPAIAGERPDLRGRLALAVDAALSTSPEKRPDAAVLAHDLREALSDPLGRPRRERAPGRERAASAPRPAVATTPQAVAERLAPGVLAGVTTALGATLLPFWPPGLVAAMTALAALAALRAPRIGLAIALSAPVLPLGNVAAGAAVLYGAVALGWLALSWTDARAGLSFVAGPILAPIGALGLLPLAVQMPRGALRRFAHGVMGVLAAALVAALHGGTLLLGGGVAGSLAVAGTDDPLLVGSAVVEVLRAHPAIVTTGLVLGVSAVLVPTARRSGLWGIAGLGAFQLAAVLLMGPSVPAVTFVLSTWALCAALGVAVARSPEGAAPAAPGRRLP